MNVIIKKIKESNVKESVRLRLRKQFIKHTYKKRRELINQEDFTIISDNCWGGTVYQSYGLSYNTPTVGMYIITEDYIKLLSDLKHYMSVELDFINPTESKHYHQLSHKGSFGTHPIGKLDDVELMLLHYESEEEAYEKWHRRCKRINWDKMIVKLNDQNLCKEEHILEFDQMDYDNKIFFSARERDHIKSGVHIREARGQDFVKASQEPFGKSKYIDVNKIINSL